MKYKLLNRKPWATDRIEVYRRTVARLQFALFRIPEMPSLFFCKQEELELVRYSLELLQPLNLFVCQKCKILVTFLTSTKLVWCLKLSLLN